MILTLTTVEPDRVYPVCGAQPELGHHYGHLGTCYLPVGHESEHWSWRTNPMTKRRDRVRWRSR